MSIEDSSADCDKFLANQWGIRGGYILAHVWLACLTRKSWEILICHKNPLPSLKCLLFFVALGLWKIFFLKCPETSWSLHVYHFYQSKPSLFRNKGCNATLQLFANKQTYHPWKIQPALIATPNKRTVFHKTSQLDKRPPQLLGVTQKQPRAVRLDEKTTSGRILGGFENLWYKVGPYKWLTVFFFTPINGVM